MNLNILYEDNHIIVVVKPPGILSQPGDLEILDMLTLLKDYIKNKYQKPGNVFLGLVHRLDLNVGGVMVFAKTSKAAKRLFEQIQDQVWNKNYYAVVVGHPPISKRVQLKDYLIKEESNRIAKVVSPSVGKEAVLEYEVIEHQVWNRIPISLLNVKLFTGRFHQIRAQLAFHGLPILNDGKYGEQVMNEQTIGLYSYQLAFQHPVLKESCVYTMLPQYFPFSLFQSNH